MIYMISTMYTLRTTYTICIMYTFLLAPAGLARAFGPNRTRVLRAGQAEEYALAQAQEREEAARKRAEEEPLCALETM